MASVNDLLKMQAQSLLQQEQPGALGLLGRSLMQAGSSGRNLGAVPGLLAQNMANNRKLQQQQIQDLLSLNKTIMDTNLLQQQVREVELRNKMMNEFLDPSNSMMGSQGGVNPGLALIAPDVVRAIQENRKFNFEKKQYEEQSTQQAKIKASEEQAKFIEKAKQDFPNNFQNYQNITQSLDGLLASPGLDELVAKSPLITAGKVFAAPGSDLANAYERLQQIKGQTFLQAFQALRGGGSITDTEGDRAQGALGRLSTAQSKEEFIAAIQELKGIMDKGIAVSKFNAGYDNLPKGALPLGYRAGSPNPFIMINNDTIEMPSIGAKFIGEAVRGNVKGYVFKDKGKTFFVTP